MIRAVARRTRLLAFNRLPPIPSTHLIAHHQTPISSPLRAYASTMSTPISATVARSSTSWQPSSLPSLGDQLPFHTFTSKIDQSPLDDREYRLIRLPNGLEAMLIRDQKTDKSSAAMDVKVGHLMDPADLKGFVHFLRLLAIECKRVYSFCWLGGFRCAHFCEHLLFLGTEKFPKENEYAEFLAQAGGYSNAVSPPPFFLLSSC